MENWISIASMFPLLFLGVFMGLPVAFCLLGIAFFFGLSVFGSAIGYQLLGTVYTVSTSYEYAAIPLFVFMGVLLENSGIALQLFESINLWTGRIPGGLAIGAIVMATLFAAASGIIGAVEVVVGYFSIPAMMKYKYNRGIIAGAICSGGALGTIIPPSIIAVVYGPMARVSIRGLFMGIVIPGLIISGSYILYIFLRALLRPNDAPLVSKEEFLNTVHCKRSKSPLKSLALRYSYCRSPRKHCLGSRSTHGSSRTRRTGRCNPVCPEQEVHSEILKKSVIETVKVTAMIMLIIVGGNSFAGVFMAKGGGALIEHFVGGFIYHLRDDGHFLIYMLPCWLCPRLLLSNACFRPIFAPMIDRAGINPLWFAVLFLLIIQTSYITPPMAPSIFYLRGMSMSGNYHRRHV